MFQNLHYWAINFTRAFQKIGHSAPFSLGTSGNSKSVNFWKLWNYLKVCNVLEVFNFPVLRSFCWECTFPSHCVYISLVMFLACFITPTESWLCGKTMMYSLKTGFSGFCLHSSTVTYHLHDLGLLLWYLEF